MQSCILLLVLIGLILVRILNDVLEVVELIGTVRSRSDGLDASIVAIAAARFVGTTTALVVYLECFELIFGCRCRASSLIRLIMLDLFKHDFISLVLGIAVVVSWSILISPEMLIDVPKSAVIQLYSLMRRLVIVFENLRC
jgi:hypothetical protein